MCDKAFDKVSDECDSAVRQYLHVLYESGISKDGNARLVRQLHEEMRQLRYKRIIGEMAVSAFGEDNARNRNKASAMRAMGNIRPPENAYIFTAADVPEFRQETQTIRRKIDGVLEEYQEV